MPAAAPDPAGRSAARAGGPAVITALALAVLVGWVIFQAGGDPLVLAQLGTKYSQGDPNGTDGYDGQFVYYLAQDFNPGSVRDKLDVPSYRYQRILLPLLVRVLSGGSPAAIPWLLAAIGILSQAFGTWIVARLLALSGARPWYALIYGLWAGFTLSVRLDLPEPLAYALVAGALLASLKGRNWLAAVLYGLALFAKEVTALFLAAQVLFLLSERRWRDILPYFLLAILPFTVFQGWLWLVFGSPGLGSGGAYATSFEWFPFAGLLRIFPEDRVIFGVFLLVFGPSILLPAIWGIWQGVRSFVIGNHQLLGVALLINAAVIPFLPFSTFREPGGLLRFGCGLILALLLYAARNGNRRVLNYSWFLLALNAFLIE